VKRRSAASSNAHHEDSLVLIRRLRLMPCFIDYLRFTIEGEILAVRIVDDLTKSFLCAAAPFCDSWSKPSSDPAGMAIAFLPTLNYGWDKVPTIPADESSRKRGENSNC